MVQIKPSAENKPSEHPDSHSWKTLFGLWFVLPILIHLRFFCAESEIVTNLNAEEVIGRESRIAMGLWQLLMIFMELGLFVVFVGYKTPIKAYRLMVFGMGLFSIFIGAAVLGRCALVKAREIGKGSLSTIRRSPSWQDLLMENIFLIIGLTANILTLVLFKICNWPKKKHQEQPFWDFGSYSNWLLKYTCVTVLLNLETIYSNLLIQIGHFVITDVLMATLIGSVMMIFGFYTCKSYDKMNFRVEYEDIEKNNP